MTWVIDEEEILLPKVRAVNYKIAGSRRLSRAWSLKVWVSPLHEDPGETVSADWDSLQMSPPVGNKGKVLLEVGETMDYVRTTDGQIWLSWYGGLALRVYAHHTMDNPYPWVFRPVMWSEKRPVAELLGTVVFFWPQGHDGHMMALSEPMMVTSVLWDANPSTRRPGLGLTPTEKSGASGLLNRNKNDWPLRELRQLSEDSTERVLSKSDATAPLVVLWHSSSAERPVDIAFRDTHEYATRVPTWLPFDTRGLPFKSLRLALYDDLGSHPLVWDDAKLPILLKNQYAEAVQERGAAGMCAVCAEEGDSGVPEGMVGSGLCSRHRALRRTEIARHRRGAIVKRKSMFAFQVDDNDVLEDDT